MSVLNFLTYIMYVAQLVLSDLSSNTRDNVCLNFLNCRYSICISEHFAYFYNLYTDHCVYLQNMGMTISKDREIFKKKIKELKMALEKEKKQQEKERKIKEKEQKKQRKK